MERSGSGGRYSTQLPGSCRLQLGLVCACVGLPLSSSVHLLARLHVRAVMHLWMCKKQRLNSEQGL